MPGVCDSPPTDEKQKIIGKREKSQSKRGRRGLCMEERLLGQFVGGRKSQRKERKVRKKIIKKRKEEEEEEKR